MLERHDRIIEAQSWKKLLNFNQAHSFTEEETDRGESLETACGRTRLELKFPGGNNTTHTQSRRMLCVHEAFKFMKPILKVGNTSKEK